jgi:hypothetical protein
MKATMYNWAGEAKNLPDWFHHDEIAEVSLEQVYEIFNTGNNVMLAHSGDDDVILFVDNRRFGQR